MGKEERMGNRRYDLLLDRGGACLHNFEGGRKSQQNSWLMDGASLFWAKAADLLQPLVNWVTVNNKAER